MYLEHLVDQHSRRRQKLRNHIASDIARFVERANVNVRDGSQKRVGEAFGLVYAAGRQAKRAGVLPPSYRCMAAAKAALEVHRSHGRAALVFDDMVRAVMSHPATIDLNKINLKSLSRKQIERCQAFIYVGRFRNRELVVPIAHINRVFPGWNARKADPDVIARSQRASDRTALDRPVGPGGETRPCYVFDVTDMY